MASILSAAIITGAQAIHPGYGLLSENAEFSELCERCHIKFIGASAPVIRRMGDKDEARRTMREAGVPVIPGTDVIGSAAEAVQAAQTIGFPLLIKARSGGGGRGIRRVDRLEDVESAFLTASAEAQSAFGDGAVYMEKLLENVKHIEVQVLCDAKGHCVCLGERECSMQRKNQKLVEESPSTAVDSALREKLYAATLRAVQAVLARVDAAGIGGGVSYGTPVGNDAQFYKDIPVCPMTYGQAMAILMLAEALYHTGEDA